MKTMTLRGAGLVAGIILCAQMAQAGETYFSFSVISPGYYAAYSDAPVYYQPPVVYQPQPVVYQSAPIVYYPQTFYYQPQPVYYRPQPVYYRPNYYNHRPVYHHQNVNHHPPVRAQPECRPVSQPVQRHQAPARHNDRDDRDNRKTRTTSPYLR
jgi:hypothetical protein